MQNPIHSTQKYSHKPGVSLLIAVVLVGMLSIFGLTVSNIVISSIRQSSNINRATEAYYAAEGALERGLLENALHGSAYTGPATTLEFCGEYGGGGPTNCSVRATYTVAGQVPQSSAYGDGSNYENMYGIPTPGTGDAVGGCNSLEATIDGQEFEFDGDGDGTAETYTDPANHPCNWSRIKLGQTVTIPLYTADPNNPCESNPAGDDICDPIDLNLSQVLVRLRTPCADDAEMCDGAERVALDDQVGSANVAGNDTIVDWQIVGTNATLDKVYTMIPNRYYNQVTCLGRCPSNSEIYESLLNTARYTSFEALPIRSSSGGKAGRDLSNPALLSYAMNFLRNQSPWNIGNLNNARPLATDAIHKPLLKLTVITTPKAFGNETIPYLEYQILSSTGVGYTPTDSSQTIRAEGFSGPFHHILEVKQPQSTGLLEYVIQQ